MMRKLFRVAFVVSTCQGRRNAESDVPFAKASCEFSQNVGRYKARLETRPFRPLRDKVVGYDRSAAKPRISNHEAAF